MAKLSKEEWIKKAAEEYQKQGVLYEGDGLLSEEEAKQIAEEQYEADEDAGDTDPVEYVKHDVTNWKDEY